MIRGTKVNLCQVEENHLPLLLTWRNDPELRQYYREYRLLTTDDQYRWWREKVLGDDTWQYFVIQPISEPCIIGFAGLTHIHFINRTAEVAIMIGNSGYREKGYGSDALRTLIRHGFNELNLNRISMEVYSNNNAIDIYRHVGFRDEGVLRQTYFHDGRYWDSHILSILEKEYVSRK